MNISTRAHARTDALAIGTEADPRWAAVRARDPHADGSFVYSVRTTGVYCRPCCGARPARPENVAFHDTPAEPNAPASAPASAAGPTSPRRGAQAAIVARLCRFIESAEQPPSLERWPRRAAEPLPPASGVQGGHRADAQGLRGRPSRPRRVRPQLGRSRTVTEAIYDAGYNSDGRFYDEAPTGAGHDADRLPRRRRRHRDPLRGRRVFARLDPGRAERGGVCAILLGDDPDALARDLQDRFPQARLVGGDAGSSASSRRVVGFVEAPGLGLDLPLDVRGTAFQQRVWQALRRSRRVRPRAMPRSRGASAHRARRAPSRRPARPTRSRSRSPAIASCAATAGSRVTAGASSASARCWSARRSDERAQTSACTRCSRRETGRRRTRARGDRLGGGAAELDDAGRATIERLLARAGDAAPGGAVPTRRAVPQPRRDGAPRLRPRRVPLLRLSAAAARRRAAQGAVRAPGADRQPLERGAGPRRCASPTGTPSSSRAATPPARRGRRRCCCSTAPATTTACTRISTASMCFRCRWSLLLSRAGPRLRRRRVRDDRAAAAHAVAADGAAAAAGRRGGHSRCTTGRCRARAASIA